VSTEFKVSVTVHNFVHKRNGFHFKDTFSYEGLEDIFHLHASNTSMQNNLLWQAVCILTSNSAFLKVSLKR
jgi:hypothetical protein